MVFYVKPTDQKHSGGNHEPSCFAATASSTAGSGRGPGSTTFFLNSMGFIWFCMIFHGFYMVLYDFLWFRMGFIELFDAF